MMTTSSFGVATGSRRTAARIGALTLLLGASAARPDHAAAQNAQDPGRWVVSAYLGATRGGPAPDVERAMRDGGYTTPFGGCAPLFGCFPESPSPASYTHANPILLSVQRRFNGHLWVEGFVDAASRWQTEGRSATVTARLGSSVTTGAIAAVVGTPGTRISVGPVLARASWNYLNTEDGSSDHVKTATVGLLASAAAAFPIGSRFTVDAIVQYRALPRMRVRESAKAPGMPAFEANMSHTYFAAGVGLTL